MNNSQEFEHFRFRDLHPAISLGTASDRYAGWIGQIYSPERYGKKLSTRAKKVGAHSFKETLLPVESVEEYFEHFGVLEIDYTFYDFLLNEKREPTRTLRAIEKHLARLSAGDSIILKAPQGVCAQKVRRAGGYEENPGYLNPELFIDRFYRPATERLGANLTGIVFEQEYQRKGERASPEILAEALDVFLSAIPQDTRYHFELRTDSYLTPPVFQALERHGAGQVLSRWTWLPPLRKQFAKAGRRFFNSGGRSVIRLMTPIGMRYEDAYAMAHPFDKMIESMFQPAMIDETVALMQEAISQEVRMDVIINNRSGGNAPLIAKLLAERFAATVSEGDEK